MVRFISVLALFAVAWIEECEGVVVRRGKQEASKDGRPGIKFKPNTKLKGRVRGPRNAIGDYNNSMTGDSQAGVTRIGTCDESFAAPDKAAVQCPQACPLMRFDETLLCHWKCISIQQCRSYQSNVVDFESGMCYVCAVPGCSQCSSSYDKCLTCHEGYDLRRGVCLSSSRYVWRVLAGILVCLVIVLLAYVTCLAWRPIQSQAALDWAMEHRSRTKPRSDDGTHKLLAIGTSLSDTVTTSGGIGTLLHFSWQRMVLIWCVFVVCVLGSVNRFHQRLNFGDILEALPGHDELTGVCERMIHASHANKHAAMQDHYLIATGFVYIVSSIGAIFLAARQRRQYFIFEESTTNMQDYGLLCSGFPRETEPEGLEGQDHARLEEEYKTYFASAWGETVLGVSIVWDTDERASDVSAMVAKTIEQLEQQQKWYPAERAAAVENGEDAPDGGRPHAKKSRMECFLDPTMQWLDNVWWGEPPCSEPKANDEEHPNLMQQDVEKLLSELKTTGFVFAVLRTKRDMLAALGTALPKFRGQFDIKVAPTEGDAEVVLWDSFNITSRQRKIHIVYGFLKLVAILCLWTCCFWGPYTYYILSWRNTAGASQGTLLGGGLLGLLITAGNQIVYAVCQVIAESAKFTCRDDRDMFYTSLYTIAVFVNTALDMWLVREMAFGFQLDAAADPTSLVRNPTMQHALYTQLVFYLWPCTLLFPFLFEPLVTTTVPYFLGKWLVRSKDGVTKHEAEGCLALPPFDLNRYGDIVVNLSMVVVFFFLTSKNIWWIVAVFMISNLYIYIWDNYRFKRCTLRTHFATQDVAIVSHYMCVLPCAMLAGAVMFKYFGGQDLVDSWAPDKFLEGHPEIWTAVSLAFILHVAVHSLILAVVVPRCVPDSEKNGNADSVPYTETASKIACNWFNANPVHCLRSQYLYRHSPPHVHYVIGKEHLQRKNTNEMDASALIIYEHPQFEKEQSILEEISHEAEEAVEQVMGRLRSTASGGSAGAALAQQR